MTDLCREDRTHEANVVATAALKLGLVTAEALEQAQVRRTNGTALSDVLKGLVDDAALERVRGIETKYREGRLGEIALDVLDHVTQERCKTERVLSTAIATRRAYRRARGERTDVFLVPFPAGVK